MENKKRSKVAVVRVRGLVNLRHDVKATFQSLNLKNKNWCVVLDDMPSLRGMVVKVKDYATWGELSEEVLEELVLKRGQETTEAPYLEFKGKKYRKFFRLNPPRKGYGRKGVKMSFEEKGALGYRGEKINDLLKRMI